MGAYTEEIKDTIYEEDDLVDKLKRAREMFRTFDKALDSFLIEHGFKGDCDNVDEKVKFISNKCKEAGVPIPRNTRKWYTEHKLIKRNSETPFQICFAFKLNIDEANDFLKRICLSRGFDCHDVSEVVYYYTLKHELSYEQAKDIISRLKDVKPSRMDAIIDKDDIIYTDLIVEEIDEIDTVEELISYLNENIEKFQYNNSTAFDTIRTIWKEISKENGIAVREKKLVYDGFDMDEDECIEDETNTHRKVRKRDDDSMWEIYLQILGLSGTKSAQFYKERSLKFMLEDNELLHPLAEESFPDRDGLVKVLNGDHLSYERVRKILILLVFYRYWGKRAISRSENRYVADEDDRERCKAEINHNLTSANYLELYPGNPYDYIILVALTSDLPLLTFRDYMKEVFYHIGI